MSSLKYQLLILLSTGNKVSYELYGVEGFTDSHVRRTLIKLKADGWVASAGVLKVDAGQGRPVNNYSITEAGRQALKDYEQQLEELR